MQPLCICLFGNPNAPATGALPAAEIKSTRQDIREIIATLQLQKRQISINRKKRITKYGVAVVIKNWCKFTLLENMEELFIFAG
ncbi:MAG: hypothetical protein IPG24_21385 [Leptospiraceae bacterium]|nr:hypothetical protein [Leptospiraceae bacterium]